MNIKTVVIAFSLAFTGVVSQNFIVNSPTPNSPYAASQILPCTVDLLGNSSTDLNLAINIVSAFPGSNIILTISTSFVVSKKSGAEKVKNNDTYYEQSVNYQIPDDIVTGLYNVVFFDRTANTEVDIPVNILGKSTNTTSFISSNSPSVTTTTRSTFQSNGVSTSYSVVTTIMNLFLISVFAFLL